MQRSLPLFVSAGDCIKLWNATAEQVSISGRYGANNINSGSNFKDVAWNCNNTKLAGVSNENGMIIYDCQEGEGNKGREVLKSREQTSVCFGNTDTELYSGGATGDVNLWSCDTGELVKTFDDCHKSPIRRLIKLNDRCRIASACTDGEIVIWNTDSGTVQTKLKDSKTMSIRGLEHSKYDRSMLCSTSDDGAVCIWNIDKQTTKNIFAHHNAPAMDLSFSTINSLLLASCGLDKKVIFYDVHGNNHVKTIPCPQPVTAICFLSNGMHVCAGTSMGNLFLYDLRHNSDPLNTIQAHSTSVQRLVLQNLKDRKRSSKTGSRTSTSGRNTSQATTTEKHYPDATNNLGSSQVHASKRRSWSKVPDIELPPKNDKPSVDSHSTSAGNTMNHKGYSLGLQTPLNRSNVSSKRDTLGSYCEGIFSPVASVNESMQGEVFESDGSGMPQQISKRSFRQSSSRIPETPASQSPSFLTNGLQTRKARSNDITQADCAAEIELSSSKLLQQAFSSTPNNHVTNSGSSPGADSEAVDTAHKMHRASENTSSDTLLPVIGNQVAVNRSSGAGVAPPHAVSQPVNFQYQLDFLRNTVHELIEDHEDNMRDEIRHFHVQLFKMFSELNDRMTQLAEQCSVNPLLLQEIERLRAENDRLRRNY